MNKIGHILNSFFVAKCIVLTKFFNWCHTERMFQNVNMLFVPFYKHIQTYSKVKRIWQLTCMIHSTITIWYTFFITYLSIYRSFYHSFIYFIFGAFQNKLQTSGHFPLNTSSILCFWKICFLLFVFHSELMFSLSLLCLCALFSFWTEPTMFKSVTKHSHC